MNASPAERLTGAALWLTAALMPLAFGGIRMWAWTLFAGLMGALLVLFALTILRGGEIRVPLRSIRFALVAFVLLVVWIVFQAVPFTPESLHNSAWAFMRRALGEGAPGSISIEPYATWTGLMRLMAFAGLFWLGLQAGRRSEWARTFLNTVIISGAIYAAYGLAIQFSGADMVLWFPVKRGNNLVSTFLNRDHAATYFGLCFLVAAARTIEHGLKGYVSGAGYRHNVRMIVEAVAARGIWPLIAGFLTGTALLLTHSRAGFASTLAGLIALLGAMAIALRADGRTRWSLALAGLLFAGLIVMLSGEQTVTSIIDTDIGAEERLSVYHGALQAIADHPVLGTGLDTFEWAFQPYAPLDATHYFTRAHNDYLELLVELGIPGAALLLISFVSLVAICVGGVRRRKRDAIFPCVAVGATALVGTHALFDFSLQIPAIAILYLLLLGTGVAQSWSTRRPASRNPGTSPK